MMENVHKIKIKLENIWIDLIRGIYAPYNVIGCVLPNLEACRLLQLVGLMQSLHDCMHVPHAPRRSDFFHDFNHLLEEQISHGTKIEPLCLSQAGLTEWTGQLPGL